MLPRNNARPLYCWNEKAGFGPLFFCEDKTAGSIEAIAARLRLIAGDTLYANRSRPTLEIVEHTRGRHDFRLTPCPNKTFLIIRGETGNRHGREGNPRAGDAAVGEQR